MPTFEDDLRVALPTHVTLSSALGTGGQGAVFKGTCHGQPAAIKAFKTTTDSRRVDRECQLLSALNCPYVVRLLEHFPITIGTDQIRIAVYEYHDGGDLTPLTRPGSPVMSEPELVTVGLQVGTGIGTLWSKRIVHRDIKPPNIVRASDGRFVLVDVGLARHLDLSDITAAGGAPGTRGYRSPEQAQGRRALTVNSDVFSLGVTLYVLALKRHPFLGADPTTGLPIDFRALAARHLSDAFIRLLRQMLEIAPARRPSDIAARFATFGAP